MYRDRLIFSLPLDYLHEVNREVISFRPSVAWDILVVIESNPN